MIVIPECETCGRSSELVRARIEEVFLSVCKRCSKLGQILMEEKQPEPKPVQPLRIIEFAPDFPAAVKSAREAKKLSRRELAERIMEKESAITRIEKGMRPTEALARKLEKALGISLSYEEKEQKLGTIKTEALTIGDILAIRMRKKV